MRKEGRKEAGKKEIGSFLNERKGQRRFPEKRSQRESLAASMNRLLFDVRSFVPLHLFNFIPSSPMAIVVVV